jgi:hypothetical protein
MMPISFAGLGVREGVFVVMYGIFGVASEISLAVSFASLAALLVAISVGGLIHLADGLHATIRSTTRPES